MGLRNAFQEIFGDKIFKGKVVVDKDVTIKGDLTLKKHATLYAPVSGEPSLGTPHKHVYRIKNNVVLTVADSPYDTSLSAQVPAGTKRVYVWGQGHSATANAQLLMQDTAGNTYCGGIVPMANLWFMFSGEVMLDSLSIRMVAVGGTIENTTVEMAFYDT